MWLPGKLSLKKYLHDEAFTLRKGGGGTIKAENFPTTPELVHRCARVIPTEQTRN